jgi:predicted ATPase/DNA-binding SARP family transcriptional activator
MSWQVQTLGRFEVTRDGQIARFRTKKTAALFAFMALGMPKPVRREAAAALFWPDADTEAARQSVRMALNNLRSELGSGVVEADRDWIWLAEGSVEVDVRQFERLSAVDPARAIALVHGSLLGEFDDDWATAEWLQFQERYAATIAQWARVASATERSKVIEAAQSALALVGCREDLHIALMRLFAASGNSALAIQQFEKLENELDEQWGEAPSDEAYAVLDDLPRSNRRDAKERPLKVDRPRSRTFIGREEAFERLLQLVTEWETGRVVTVTGTGGAGKSRLVQEMLQSVSTRSWFVPMVSESTVDGAWDAIRKASGLPSLEKGELIAQVASKLSEETTVLVLDNLEQLIPDVGTVIQELKKRVPGLRLVATSRVALECDGEVLLRVGPLRLPEFGMSLSELRETPSVELLCLRAEAAEPSFRLTPDIGEATIRLVRKLDGLPLAIELAAVHVPVFSPAQILANIERSLDSLYAPAHLSEERHRSLTKAIEWSYDLLNPDAQALLRALSMIVGSFDLATATRISSDSVSLLPKLVRASMVNSDASSGTPRFAIFETIRAFCRAKATESGDLDRCERLHHDAFASHAVEHFADPKQRVAAIYTVSSDAENYRLACHFGVRQNHNPELTAHLVEAFTMGVSATAGIGALVADDALTLFERPDDRLPNTVRANLGLAWSRLTANVADLAVVDRVLSEARQMADGDEIVMARAALYQAIMLKARGDYQDAIDELEFARDIFRRHKEPTLEAQTLYNLGLTLCCVARYQESLELHLEALPAARRGYDKPLLVRILFDAGSELAHLGRGEEAPPLFQEAIQVSRELGSKKLEGLTRWQEGDALISGGKPAEAIPVLKQSLELVNAGGFPAAIKWIYLNVGVALTQTGQSEEAARWLGKGTTIRVEESRPLADYETAALDKAKAQLLEQLGPMSLDRFWAEGVQTPWETLTERLA